MLASLSTGYLTPGACSGFIVVICLLIVPKDIFYGALASGRRTKGHPQLCYKDVYKRDMKALDINTESWEDLAADRMMWRSTLNQHLKTGEEKLHGECRNRTKGLQK